MHQLAQAAPSSALRHTREGQALDCGRQFLRDALQSAAQQRIDQDEKNAPPAAACAPRRTDLRVGMAAT
jgi:hypothetical protein